MNYTDEFINFNNDRILSTYAIQARYKPDFPCQPEKKVHRKEQTDKACKTGTSVSENLKKWLMVVSLNQYKKPLTELFELAGLSLGTGSRVNKQAEQQGLVKTIKANLGRGNPRYPVLTEAGYKILGVEAAKFYGRGAGLEHVLYQYLISEHLKEFKPKLELNRSGKFIDLGIQVNESLVCIEVEMTPAHIRENLEKDFNLAGADLVIVTCVDVKVKAKAIEILSTLSEKIRSRTRVLLVSEFLNSDAKQMIDGIIRELSCKGHQDLK